MSPPQRSGSTPRSPQAMEAPGPFTAQQIRPGDRYEVSRGHAIYCAPSGGAAASGNLFGAAVLASDPGVTEAGIDVGYSPDTGTLRAPDIAVGNVPRHQGGWVAGVPPLAVEYAGVGQDEQKLQEKIADLVEHGTRYLWVVRLVGPRRVEIIEPGRPLRVATVGESLTAPGVLRNAVPVEALFEPQAANAAMLRNLLQRSGYQDLEEVRREGREEGREEGQEQGRMALVETLLAVLRARGIPVDEAATARVRGQHQISTLQEWVARAATATRLDEVWD